jgi:transcriptional regulator with XRE-family HTH domain
MDDVAEEEDQPELPVGAGETLRARREAQGMSLAQVAAVTRITQRHLALIEGGDLGALPGRTYAIGFARNYAKAVGLDQDKIARQVQDELAMIESVGPGRFALSFEPGDPARVPTARLAWFSAAAALILFVGGSIFVWSTYIAPAGSLPWQGGGEAKPAMAANPDSATRAVDPAPVVPGQVVFTALEGGIWVKFYDRHGKTLLQKQMAQGEHYAVPADADGPQLWTGRPDALAITVGGKPVPKLADIETTIKDAPVTAEALLARAPAAPTAPSPSASPTG